VDFKILGALEARSEGRPISVRGPKQRGLLAVLLLHANEPLPPERLIDKLWGERPPPRAAKSLQMVVSRLRRALVAGAAPDDVAGVPETCSGGYVIRLEEEQLDLGRFERRAAEGRRLLAAGRPENAASQLTAALEEWRGRPLADLALEPFAQTDVARLEELRLGVLEDRIEADLASGRHAELVGEIQALVEAHPFRERLRGQLMLALYRAGRQPDALAAYRAARATLGDELGLEPTPALRQLEQAILTHDRAVRAPAGRATPMSRLPVPLTRTLGREGNRDAVADLLRRADIRLVTLTGPGGVGKTRLALEVARKLEPELPDGAWLVSLAATARSEHVPSAIAQALGVTAMQGETPRAAVERFLAAKGGLLVLDNFEHLLAAAPFVSHLLAACAALTVLATSREALRVQAEHRYAVAPLQVPEDGEPAAVEQSPAGALFVERARSRDRGFELTAANARAIADVCRRLDGLPLAIELATARATMLGVEELNARLAQALDVLGSGPRDAPARQRTLRATIEWSHRLLSAPEAEAFARFAVFAGGATIEAAEQVTGADLEVLEGLLEKHLILRRSNRLLMLETVREYAHERLEADKNAAEIHRGHCRRYLSLAERAEPELFTRGEAQWLPRLDAEIDNFRAALDWSLRHDSTLALRLVGLLHLFWEIRNMFDEGLEWIEAALDAAGDAAPLRDRARARRAQVHLLGCKGSLYDAHGLREEALARAAEALALSRQAGDPAGTAEALLALGALEVAETLPQRRRRALAEKALIFAREAGNDRLVAIALMSRAVALPLEEGAAELERAATALRKIGGSRHLVGLYSDAAYNAIKVGSPERARPLLDRALPLASELGDPLQRALVWGNVGLEALFTGDLERAQTAFAEQLRLCREHVIDWLASEGLAGLAASATRRGDSECAALLLGAAIATGPVADADVMAELEHHFFAPARARYGKARWRASKVEGARLSFEEAIGVALRERSRGLDVSGEFDPGAVIAGGPAAQALMTFMFTDMVGSTRLLDELGDDGWTELLRSHDTIVREQFLARAGREVKHEGDGFFVAFTDAAAAVEAGCAIQRALAVHRAELGALPPVRIGIHTTLATPRGGDFIGRGVHETSRLAGAARGDEVLVSLRTFEAAGELFQGCNARELKLQGFRSPVGVLNIAWES
jgi:predicted ATPase/DNA-binding SARP family transcriptional activator/class 3 adenylate cyclase